MHFFDTISVRYVIFGPLYCVFEFLSKLRKIFGSDRLSFTLERTMMTIWRAVLSALTIMATNDLVHTQSLKWIFESDGYIKTLLITLWLATSLSCVLLTWLTNMLFAKNAARSYKLQAEGSAKNFTRGHEGAQVNAFVEFARSFTFLPGSAFFALLTVALF